MTGRAARTKGRGKVSRPIRLAVVIPSLGGGVRYLAPIVQSLADRDVTVRVFTGIPPRNGAPFPLEVVTGRVLHEEIEESGYNPGSFMYTSPRLVLKLARWRPDAIIAVEYGLATLWSLIAGFGRRCTVAIFQEHRSPDAYRRSLSRRLFRLLLARLADAFIANTEDAANEITTLLRVPSEKVFRVRLLLPPDRAYLLDRPIDLPPVTHRPVFLFVGQLIGRKNVRVLVDAARSLVEQGRRFTIWIAGEGPDREMLESAVEETGLREVVFLGAVPYRSIGFAYEASDVFVMPTLADVMSVAVLEASRFDLPIIGSKQGGFAGHVVLEGVNGFLFDPSNAEELALHMRTLIDDDALLRRMGRRSGDWLAGVSHEDSADRLIQMFRSMRRRRGMGRLRSALTGR
jgi:glycosyltransferase involved in cell wall biosynthesis